MLTNPTSSTMWHNETFMVIIVEGGSLRCRIQDYGGVLLSRCESIPIADHSDVDKSENILHWSMNEKAMPGSPLQALTSALQSTRPGHVYVLTGAIRLEEMSLPGRLLLGSVVNAFQSTQYETGRTSIVFSNPPDDHLVSDWICLFGPVEILDDFAAHLVFLALARRSRNEIHQAASNDHFASQHVNTSSITSRSIWSGEVDVASYSLGQFNLFSNSCAGIPPSTNALNHSTQMASTSATFVCSLQPDLILNAVGSDRDSFELRLDCSSEFATSSDETTKLLHRSARFCSSWRQSRCALLLDFAGARVACIWVRRTTNDGDDTAWVCFAKPLMNIFSIDPRCLDVAYCRKYLLGIVGKSPVVYPYKCFQNIPSLNFRQLSSNDVAIEIGKTSCLSHEDFEEAVVTVAKRRRQPTPEEMLPDIIGHQKSKQPRLSTPSTEKNSSKELKSMSSNPRKPPSAGVAGAAESRSKRLAKQNDNARGKLSRDLTAAEALLRRRQLYGRPISSNVSRDSLQRPGRKDQKSSPRKAGLMSLARKHSTDDRSTTLGTSLDRFVLDDERLSSSQESLTNRLRSRRSCHPIFSRTSSEMHHIDGVDYCPGVPNSKSMEADISDYEERRFNSGFDFDSLWHRFYGNPHLQERTVALMKRSIIHDFRQPSEAESVSCTPISNPGLASSVRPNGRTSLGRPPVMPEHNILSCDEIGEILSTFVLSDEKSFSSQQREWLPGLLKSNAVDFSLSTKVLLASALSTDEITCNLLRGRIDAKSKDGVYYLIRQWVEDVRMGSIEITQVSSAASTTFDL